MESILSFEESTQTIRQLPQNYCIATKSKGYWMIDFDIASDEELVIRVCNALFQYENRYCTGLELLSKVTPNPNFKQQKVNDWLHIVRPHAYTYTGLDNQYRQDYQNLYNYLKRHRDKYVYSKLEFEVDNFDETGLSNYVSGYKLMNIIIANIKH